MLMEGLIAVLLFGAYKKAGQKGVLTPEREKIYKSALEHFTDPRGLVKLAEVYEKEGLTTEGAMLRRRAQLRGQSQAQKQARRAAYDKGMRSRDVDAIERLADAFESITATGSAEALRKHAADVRLEEATKAQAESELEMTPPFERSAPIEVKAIPVDRQGVVVDVQNTTTQHGSVPTETQLEDAGLVTHTTPPPRQYPRTTPEDVIEDAMQQRASEGHGEQEDEASNGASSTSDEVVLDAKERAHRRQERIRRP